jgi:hypothetical protein
MFKDETLLNQNNTQSLSKENELQEYLINDPRDMSALICSDITGLTYDQIINKRLKLYSLAVKDDISFSRDSNFFTPYIDLMIGFLEFENQCRQLGIDNIEFQAVDSFSVRSYARFANNGL